MPSLQFKGRVFVENFHLGVPFHQLTPVHARGLSRKASLHDNLIVEGDNLLALKALLPTYHGKVKCICIDPPYNTGNEGWAYNDRVNSPMMKEWFGRPAGRLSLQGSATATVGPSALWKGRISVQAAHLEGGTALPPHQGIGDVPLEAE